MPAFTIETTYRLPIYRHRSYEADTLEQACRLAVDDDDWRFERRDYECAGETYVTGAWLGRDIAYQGAALPVPSQFDETVRRKADHYATLLGFLKQCARPSDPVVQAAIAEAEAILAGKPHPV
jgi:hypothetical protein